jgi:hypothetical protein
MANDARVERELDGNVTEYFDLDVRGDRVERLLTELFTEHWAGLSAGPLIQGAVFEVRFTAPPRVTMLDGYMTVDVGPWHFHLCVNDHREAPPALAAVRRVARAAFFRTRGASAADHAPMTWGLRLWNGRGEQMVTLLFPSAYYSDAMERLGEPDWRRTALWERLRARETGTAGSDFDLGTVRSGGWEARGAEGRELS